MKVILLDSEWQYPAITEKHAYEKIVELNISNPKVCYLGFPWATYIDKKDRGIDVSQLDKKLDQFKNYYLSQGFSKVLTTCQHIKFRKIGSIFKEVGITNLFCSHKSLHENKLNGIKLHSFPLYPTQIVPEAEKKYLYSFVGAKSNNWYLSNIRACILSELKSSDDVFIKGRDSWHYNDIVYKKQINGDDICSNLEDVNKKNTIEFIDIMSKSKFALCPSGTGPNSIRLWECIESDIIPVVFSNTYEAPRHADYFKKFAIVVDETEESVKSIDSILRGISKQEYLDRLQLLRSYKILYGKENFVNDIVELILDSSFHQADLLTDLETEFIDVFHKYMDRRISIEVLSDFISRCATSPVFDKRKRNLLNKIRKDVDNVQ